MNLLNTMTLNRKKLVILAIIIILVVVGSLAAFTTIRKPSSEDFTSAKAAVANVTKTQEALPTAANGYFDAYSRELNTTGSAQKAKDNSTKEFQAFSDAETSALEAIQKLVDSRAGNNDDVEKAITQFAQVMTDQTNYYAGMVGSYAGFKGLFSGNETVSCSGIFIRSTESLAERRDLVKKAAANCYPAIDELKKSKNSSISNYAFQMERRVKLLEQDAIAIAKSEQDNSEFSKQMIVFEKKAADAKARNAPEQELLDLADEIKAFNVKIKDNQADFDYSSSRYLSTTKEFPPLSEAVFSTSIPSKIKTFTSLSDVRLATLNLVLDDKLVD